MNSWRPTLDEIDRRLEAMGLENDQFIPDTVLEWLIKLYLLEGVPLSYLAAEERMLPMESIRFFSVNPDWMAALLDGAMSIGRMTPDEVNHDAAHLRDIHARVIQNLSAPRWRRMHQNHRKCQEPPKTAGSALTGFMIRSELVTHWIGMEVQGFDQDETPVILLRLEQLSNKILIGLFAGQVHKVEMAQPIEEMHFGTRDNKREIQVRYVDDQRIGRQTGQIAAIKAEENGRVDVKDLVAQIESKLNALGTSDLAQVHLGSAELALQMLSVAGHCTIRRKSE